MERRPPAARPSRTPSRTALTYIEPQRPNTIARSLAIGNPADGPYASRAIRDSGGWAEDVSDVEIVSAIQELAETEGVFTETAGGVTTAVTARLYAHGRIQPDELTVTCITGNGLKTTDCLQGAYEQNQAIRPRLSDFEAFVEERNAVNEALSAGRRKLCPLESCCRMHFRSTPTTSARSLSTAANLPELITEIEGRFPALRQHLRGEDGQIRRFINFYVNEEDIRFLGNEKYASRKATKCW